MNPGWRFLQEDVEKRNFNSIHEKFYDAPEWIKSGNNGLAKVGYPDHDWNYLGFRVVLSPFFPTLDSGPSVL